MQKPLFHAMSGFVEKEERMIGDIPCLIYRPKEKKALYPTVINYHGWSSKKEFQHFKATVLASFGYQVVIPDALYHGERNAIPHDEPGMMEKYFQEVLLQSVEESDELLYSITHDLDGDPEKVGVIGHSMGGFISSGVFVKHKNIKTMVVINGSCAWEMMLENYQGDKEDHSEGFLKLKEYDPYEHLEAFEKRPFLLVHGEVDKTVPIEPQRAFFDKAKSYYGSKSERIGFLEAEKMDHAVSMAMFEETINWLHRNL